MSEIKDRVEKELDEMLEVELDAYTQGLLLHPMNMPRLKGIAKQSLHEAILSIPELAIVDREAKVPQRQKLGDGDLLLRAEDKNDIYLNGQLIAQEHMLKAGWAKEVKSGS